jgi:thymidylate synthase (FAD)
MNRIDVEILEGNLNGMPKFLARLTQRGHLIKGMDDVLELRDEVIKDAPSKYLLSLPHTTIQRMNYITIAITGLSTKAVSQLRTHAKRLTFISTSTQYSDFSGCNDNYVIPDGLTDEQKLYTRDTYDGIQHMYERLIQSGVDKDKASYILPQGLRKTLIISGSLDDWNYVLRTRLCHRNTEEVQYIANLIVARIRDTFGEEYIVNMLPTCVNGKCLEGKFSCGERFDENSLY